MSGLDTETVLDVANLSVRFGGVVALADISLAVPRGPGIFGIIGPNGAGKTTLFNTISGFVRPQPGCSLRLDGQEITGLPIHRIAKLGITRTFQNLSLIRDQTVEQNILMGFHSGLRYGVLASLLPLRSVRTAEAAVRQRLLEDLDLLNIPRRFLQEKAGLLPLGMQKKIEVARALAAAPKLLMLDEPAGGLNDEETGALAEALLAVASRPGLTILLIDHDMNLMMQICARICVLNFGRRIALGSPEDVQRDAAVIESYLGTPNAA